MQIILNGQKHDAPAGQTVIRLLEKLDLDPARVAIELDGAIIRRPEWPARVLTPGARLEIIHFVGGG
ncbi:MAG TPA: sulfur carrier protein ThiS [Bryobacteraceae bacterium]